MASHNEYGCLSNRHDQLFQDAWIEDICASIGPCYHDLALYEVLANADGLCKENVKPGS
jgi:hypothetical protein